MRDRNRVFRLTYPCPIHGAHRFRGPFMECMWRIDLLMQHYGCPTLQLDDNTSAEIADLDECDNLVDNLVFTPSKGESVEQIIERYRRGDKK